MKKLVAFALLLNLAASAQQKIDPASIREKMEWYSDAKLGIFIHWGIYAVDGVSESWSFHNGDVTWDEKSTTLKETRSS